MHIEWSDTARESLEDALDYTIEEFGKRIARRFLDQIDESLQHLLVFPRMAPIEPFLKGYSSEYRSYVVINEIKLLYRIDGDCIRVEYIWNVRRSPETVMLRLGLL
jgi:plasmid stabilization system protein ParE